MDTPSRDLYCDNIIMIALRISMQRGYSMMDEDVLLDGICDSLQDTGYKGPLLEEDILRTILEKGLDSDVFIDTVITICSELKQLYSLQEAVSKPQGPSDAESFQLEMRSFLQELQCPHDSLRELDLLSSFKKKLLLVDFIVSELLTARLLKAKKKDLSSAEAMEVDGATGAMIHSVPANLEAILRAYGIKKPPPNITVKQLFDRIIEKTHEQVSKCPKGHLTPSLVSQPLSEDQWAQLDRINDELTKEYSVRRQMLLTRCDVTVQSFRWSDRVKGKEEEFARAHQSRRDALSKEAPVSIARVLATKNDLLVVEKTSSESVRKQTQSSVNKVIIGKVPDRGGRPQETRPPPEMPSFKKRSEPPKDQRGGGAGGRGQGKKGGKGGGRVQGGWAGGRGGHKEGSGGWQGHSGHGDGGQHKQQEKHYQS